MAGQDLQYVRYLEAPY